MVNFVYVMFTGQKYNIVLRKASVFAKNCSAKYVKFVYDCKREAYIIH